MNDKRKWSGGQRCGRIDIIKKVSRRTRTLSHSRIQTHSWGFPGGVEGGYVVKTIGGHDGNTAATEARWYPFSHLCVTGTHTLMQTLRTELYLISSLILQVRKMLTSVHSQSSVSVGLKIPPWHSHINTHTQFLPLCSYLFVCRLAIACLRSSALNTYLSR